MAKYRKNGKNARRPSRKDAREGQFNREREANKEMSPENDLSWYSRYPNLLTAAGSFPFPYRPGMLIDLGKINNEGTGAKEIQRQYTIPGVMTLDWMPAIGTSAVPTDPASILGKEVYSRVRQVYSGSLDADAPDYVMYLLSLDSIFAYIAWLKRLYRVLTVWTPENYALPDVVLAAMGLKEQSVANLRVDRTKLWQIINELVLQSRKFSCPSSIDYINRHYWMSDNVYSDAPQINSQFYMFNPKALFQFAMLDMPDGTPGPGVQMVRMPWTIHYGQSTQLTVEELYDFGIGLINALVEWDDAYTINGYLRRAFEGDAMFIVDELPMNQPFNPVYSEEVLSQIENSRPIPMGAWISNSAAAYAGFNVTQNVLTNAVLSKPTYTVTSTATVTDADADTLPPVLNIRSVTPTVADNVLASRLQAVVVSKSVVDNKVTYEIQCASEIPICWSVTTGTNGGNGIFHEAVEPIQQWNMSSSGIVAPSQVLTTLATEAFDWHPLLFITAFGPTYANTTTRVAIMGDVNNITTISQENLANLHKMCLFSEFNSFSLF